MGFARTMILLTAILGILSPLARAEASPAISAEQLIKDMAYNELQDRERDSYWSYRVQQQMGLESFVKHQVETGEGPIYRILQEGGRPLTDEEERREEERLNTLLSNPGALNKNKESHLEDEERMQRMIKLMPMAFLFEYAGQPHGDIVTVNFRPDPGFKAPTYESRVFHGMAGTIVINQRLKRLVEMHGHLICRIDFGYGLLGYVDKGGEFEFHREQVSATRWKTDMVKVHVSGRVILLKTVSKDHYEVRSGFQPVPTSISLGDAKQLLEQAASRNEAKLQ